MKCTVIFSETRISLTLNTVKNIWDYTSSQLNKIHSKGQIVLSNNK